MITSLGKATVYLWRVCAVLANRLETSNCVFGQLRPQCNGWRRRTRKHIIHYRWSEFSSVELEIHGVEGRNDRGRTNSALSVSRRSWTFIQFSPDKCEEFVAGIMHVAVEVRVCTLHNPVISASEKIWIIVIYRRAFGSTLPLDYPAVSAKASLALLQVLILTYRRKSVPCLL